MAKKPQAAAWEAAHGCFLSYLQEPMLHPESRSVPAPLKRSPVAAQYLSSGNAAQIDTTIHVSQPHVTFGRANDASVKRRRLVLHFVYSFF